ncbi:hypothetical protein [[Mycoplasma] cavipharyngis]|uniref:hypothetical protein n=1 Tax=[Mycoplasma] cavipharyngis TaxID=92757 RepID=UPI003704383D
MKKQSIIKFFITFKTEYRVLKYLESFGWKVSKARSFYDQFHQSTYLPWIKTIRIV